MKIYIGTLEDFLKELKGDKVYLFTTDILKNEAPLVTYLTYLTGFNKTKQVIQLSILHGKCGTFSQVFVEELCDKTKNETEDLKRHLLENGYTIVNGFIENQDHQPEAIIYRRVREAQTI